ncbi:MAG: PIN domain-containing protein [Bryobacterales bacterium]
MRERRILLDTGPLVALLAPNDVAHQQCLSAARSAVGSLITCWPVVTEAAWLLRRNQRTLDAMFQWIESSTVELIDIEPADMRRVREILTQYASLNPQLADACLVHLADREAIDTIFTLDRRDFAVYRNKRGKAFRLLPA